MYLNMQLEDLIHTATPADEVHQAFVAISRTSSFPAHPAAKTITTTMQDWLAAPIASRTRTLHELRPWMLQPFRI